MPPIAVTARRGAPEETSADTRVIGLFEGDSLPDEPLRALSASGEASGKFRKLAVTHEDGRRVIVVGLGKQDEFDAERARVAAAVAAGRARDLSAKSLSWSLPRGEGAAGALVEGTLLALYRFDRFKSSADDDDEAAGAIASLEITSESLDPTAAVEIARVRAEAQNAARDLQNLPSNVANPEFLEARAEELAERHEKLSFESFGREEIRSMEMGAFTAVAQGSDTEPRLIVLRYDGGGGGGGPHLGYVGKAVTFDTGGISIKPSAKMQEMKFDMSGGAAVIEALGAIAELDIPVRITAVVPSTENMPSGHSTKPGDIVTAMNGKTIEVNNTDAEGRLILADALAYVVREGAERIVDLATLTGAIVVALGSTYAGLFSNDDDWLREVDAASTATGELGWRLPLHPEFFELTKGQYADLTNASDQRKASSCYAAEFLRQFVDERPWVHVDIAGTAWGQGRAYVGNGASGFGVRMLVELAQRVADAARGG